MNRIFFTSDTFFGRKNILKHDKRNFGSVEEMDKELIKKWNQRVEKGDIIYHLGNFAWDPFSANYALQNLHGKIFFLRGNKDKALIETTPLHENVSMIEDQIFELSELNVVLCHYPLELWNGKENGSIHLHGHSYIDFPINLDKMLRINVCADYWNLYPIEFEMIVEIIKEYKDSKK